MFKENCKIGQRVAYFPHGGIVEFGIVEDIRAEWAFVKYEGDKTPKSTYYRDLEAR